MARYRVVTKSKRLTWEGSPSQIVRQMASLDFHMPGDLPVKDIRNRYMENVRNRLSTLDIDLNFPIGDSKEFLEALLNAGLIELEVLEG